MTTKDTFLVLKDFILYLCQRKKWWLIPVVFVIALLSLFAIGIESGAVLPFIYAMF